MQTLGDGIVFVFIFVSRERLKANDDSNKIPKRLRHRIKILRKPFSFKDALKIMKQSCSEANKWYTQKNQSVLPTTKTFDQRLIKLKFSHYHFYTSVTQPPNTVCYKV